MPVEVLAELTRKGGVYLSGETLECIITLKNIRGDKKEAKKEIVAWGSAQILCQEILNNQRIKIKKPENLSQQDITNGSTSFIPSRGEHGCTVFSSKPVILCCDLELAPEETKQLSYSEVLPAEDIPPSFKGSAVKYLYKLTIGIQHINCPVKVLRVSFRVLTLTGYSNISFEENGLSPNNPFLRLEQNRPQLLDIANELIETITCCKSLHTYNVTNDKGLVCELFLRKKCFKLGEDVTGTFKFPQKENLCSQFLVCLQTAEEISEEYRGKDQKPIETTHFKQHAFCVSYKQCEMSLQIPLTCTPSFFTDLVNVKWKLHFEFVISNKPLPLPEENDDGSSVWVAPQQLQVQTMVWDLPIKIYPCSPVHAGCANADAGKIYSLII